MLPFCLPFEQSFLVLSQDVYGSFLRESRIGQSLLHFGNLHIRFFQLFFEPRLFGCSVNHALERKIQITKFGTDSRRPRSEEHTSELQSHSFISYAVFCLKKEQPIRARRPARPRQRARPHYAARSSI